MVWFNPLAATTVAPFQGLNTLFMTVSATGRCAQGGFCEAAALQQSFGTWKT
jgi:hypothetical protein